MTSGRLANEIAIARLGEARSMFDLVIDHARAMQTMLAKAIDMGKRRKIDVTELEQLHAEGERLLARAVKL